MSTRSDTAEIAPDDAVLARFGYKQELKRSLTAFELFGVSFSTTSITTGLFLMVGPTIALAGPLGFWLVPLIVLPSLAVAAAYAGLSRRVPIAGLEYQWGRRIAGVAGGLIAGWLGFVASIVGVVSVAYVLASTILPALFSYTTTAAGTTWITIGIIAALAIVLGASVKLTGKITRYAAISEIVAVVGLGLALFVVGGLRGHLHGGSLIFSHAGVPKAGYFSLGNWKTIGAFWVTLTVVFYGAGSTGWQNAGAAAEEGPDPARTVPRAMYLTILLVTLLEIPFLIGLVLNIRPGELKALSQSPTAVADIMKSSLGAPLEKFFLLIVGFNMLACALAIFLQSTRYVFAMARDGNFPGHTTLKLAVVHRKLQTPVPATVLCFLLLAGTLLYFGPRESALTNLIGAGGLSLVFAYLAGVTLYAIGAHKLAPIVPERTSRARRVLIVGVAYVWLLFMVWVFHLPIFKTIWIYLAVMLGIGALFVASVLISRAAAHADRPTGTGAGGEPTEPADDAGVATP